MLVRVLDGIRGEAIDTKFAKRYAVFSPSPTAIREARSRAYIHLYLKVMFGLDEFLEREECVTDGTGDGGIDGYFIDVDQKTITLIQSKFRENAENFENKKIDVSDILSMQIKRIVGGEEADETGIPYNGKIQTFQKKIFDIPDLGRYKYRIAIIANLKSMAGDAIRRLTDGHPTDIVDFQKSYKELLFPVISGTLFRASGLSITLDLSNKTTGTKIGYSSSIGNYECEVTVVFVPTIEIAKIMSKYKNSILLYNPRSYLEFEGEKVNNAIRESLTSKKAEEFALLNNGITIVCDESGINEQSGRKYRAKLFLLNPQIINGGQTAYTLSRIYDELHPDVRESVFTGKEVLVRVIALNRGQGGNEDELNRIRIIEKISLATNSQTVVTSADRTSGDPLHTHIQIALFERHGLLYERKKGEFNDSFKIGYISENDVIDRTLFARIYLTAKGNIRAAMQRRIKTSSLGVDVLTDILQKDDFILTLYTFKFFTSRRGMASRKKYSEIFSRVYAATVMSKLSSKDVVEEKVVESATAVEREWEEFLRFSADIKFPFLRTVVDRISGEQKVELKESRHVFGPEFEEAVDLFFVQNVHKRMSE